MQSANPRWGNTFHNKKYIRGCIFPLFSMIELELLVASYAKILEVLPLQPAHDGAAARHRAQSAELQHKDS